MKAYGSLAKREKDDPQNSTTTDTGETPRIEGFSSRDGNVEFAWTPNQNHDFTAGYGFDRQDRDSDSLDKTASNARTTPSAIMGVGITAPAN